MEAESVISSLISLVVCKFTKAESYHLNFTVLKTWPGEYIGKSITIKDEKFNTNDDTYCPFKKFVMTETTASEPGLY